MSTLDTEAETMNTNEQPTIQPTTVTEGFIEQWFGDCQVTLPDTEDNRKLLGLE